MRLHKTAMPTTPVARVLMRFVGIAGSVTDATEQRSGVLRKRNQEMFGERRLPACSCRQLAGNIDERSNRLARSTSSDGFRQAAETSRLAACAPQTRFHANYAS